MDKTLTTTTPTDLDNLPRCGRHSRNVWQCAGCQQHKARHNAAWYRLSVTPSSESDLWVREQLIGAIRRNDAKSIDLILGR